MNDTVAIPQISLVDAMHERRSVRGYLPTPVPEATLKAIFTLAQTAPSNCNIQPWEVYVASGATRDALRARMTEGAMTGRPMNPDIGFMPQTQDLHRQRQFACAAALYGAMGIERDDKMGRQMASLRNFQLFDAPHVCFIGMHKRYEKDMAVSVGMYAQNLMLAMTAYGVSSCAQGAMSYYPDDVRHAFGISPDIQILFGISFGYEDPSVAANNARTNRAELSECVVFKDDPVEF